MYAIYSDGSLVWSPESARMGYEVYNTKLSTELNAFGSLEFTMPANHPMYDKIQRMKSVVTVERDGVQVWRGRLLEIEKDFYNQKKCTCEGELAYLVDYIQGPFEYTGGLIGYLEYILGEYNKGVDKYKRFYVGDVTIVDPNDYIYRYKDTYNTTWDVLNEQLVDSYGGYLIPRTDNGAHYLDYLSELPESTQEVRFGRNLIDISEVTDSSEVFTALIPLGALPDGESDEGKRLTVESVNDGKIYIENAAGIEQYGRIYSTKTYDDITTAKALMSRGISELETGILSSTTITANAVDLSMTEEEEPLEVGKMVHVVSEPHGVDVWLPVSKVEGLDLQEAGKEKYTLGKTLETLTDAALKAEKAGKVSRPKKALQVESEAVSYDDFWGES